MDFLVPHYRLIVSKKDALDQVAVEVEVQPGIDPTNKELQQRLSAKIKNTIGLSMQVELRPTGSIPGSQGGKLSRILDRR